MKDQDSVGSPILVVEAIERRKATQEKEGWMDSLFVCFVFGEARRV